MTQVFIGGSRRVHRLSASVLHRLDRIIAQGFSVLVGDANGADKAVQSYLHQSGFRRVEVFCSGDRFRNNVGNWPLRRIEASNSRTRDRAFYTAKDRVMTEEATIGLMIWDGSSVGTLSNVLRMLRQGKTVVLYSAPEQTFTNLRTLTEWQHFVKNIDPKTREQVEAAITGEPDTAPPQTQAAMFG